MDQHNAQGSAGSLGERSQELLANAGDNAAALWGWLRAEGPEQALLAAIAIGLFLGLRILRAFLCGALRSRKRPDNAPRNVASALIGGTWSLFLLILSLQLVAPFAENLSNAAGDALSTLFMIGLIIQGAVWLRILIRAISTGYLSSAGHDGGPGSTAMTLIKTLSGVLIWAVAAVMILTNLGYDVGPIIAGLGIGGLAIGLALQNVFKDLFASLSIIFDQPFVRGDFIKFGGGEYQGQVEKIGMKTTRLRSLSGEQIIVGNAQILDKEVRNFQRMNARRAAFDIGVVYQTPHAALRRVPELVEQAVGAVNGVRFNRCRLKSFGDSAIVFDTVFWVDDNAYDIFLERQEAVLLNIHAAFEDNAISFAYPTRSVHIETAPANI
ncbi:MAG: mechanosensitive ion channel family protein [Pseudomonadota bacterium]